jgi:alkanesulfonate monooxygenase SsuD/methylene tetrahydromethanopterin reductase-like flavin-dependent oxidoreductase (luciferase family)
MRVGIVILPELAWARARDRWRRAEEYGFDHAWTYDHLGWRDLADGPWFDAVPTLTAAASVTRTIRLGTLVASPNFRHPAHFAREVTALDDISGGRLTLGIGAGGTGFDADVLGVPPLSARQRTDRFGEFVRVLDGLLRDERITHRGEYYTAVDARAIPGCVQRPRVPFLLAANGPRTMRLAARYGQGWVTTGPRTDDLDGWWRAVADLAQRFTDALGTAGRDPATVERYLSLDSAPRYSLSTVDYFEEAVGRAGALGFTDVVTHWPRPDSWYAGHESVLEQAAGTLSRRA